MPRLEANVSDEFYGQLKAAAEQAERPLASIVREASRMWLHSFENGTANRASVTALGADPTSPRAVAAAEPRHLPDPPRAVVATSTPEPPVEPEQVRRPPAAGKPPLAPNCRDVDMHWKVQPGGMCKWCQGYAP